MATTSERALADSETGKLRDIHRISTPKFSENAKF